MAQLGFGGVELDRGNLKAIEDMFRQVPKEVSQYSIWMKFWRFNTKPLIKAAPNSYS